MKLLKALAVVLAMTLALIFPTSTQAHVSRQLFAAALTEDFAFLGCPAPVGPDAFTCGTAVALPIGKATVETVLTGFDPLPSGCFTDTHVSTLTLAHGRGTLTVAINGTLCGTDGPNFVLDGTYAIAGGTGSLAGATGHGLVHAVRQDGPIREYLIGWIVVPGGH